MTRKKIGAFYLRQALGLYVFSFALYIVYAIIGTLLVAMGSFFVTVADIFFGLIPMFIVGYSFLGVYYAIEGKEEKLPLIGKYSSDMLKNTFEA